MSDPTTTLRAAEVDGLVRGEPIHEWVEGKAALVADAVTFRGTPGAILAYTNPPVHQVGNPGLAAYLEALGELAEHADHLRFLILTGPCDPAHAGGDIRESLTRLDATLALREEKAAAGATDEELWALYDWGDARLDKGFALYKAVRGLSEKLTTVAVCGGGTRFGGSAEIALMADLAVADSRAGMSFSESQIGLIPGWGGVGRAVTKAGFDAARSMAYSAAIVGAPELAELGLVDRVVEIAEPLPRMGRTGDREADKAAYRQALAENEARTAPVLLAAALQLALDPPARGEDRPAPPALDLDAIRRRADPATYEGLWGQPLREVKAEIEERGKPLAPQSVDMLDALFARFEGQPEWDEEAFILAEKDADAALYRDPRFRAGIVATLEQRVADFRRS